MKTTETCRVKFAGKIENIKDLWAVERGLLKGEDARFVDITDASGGGGPMSLGLPTRLINKLGLQQRGPMSANVTSLMKYDAVRLTIMGRDCTIDVVEVPDLLPILLGDVPLDLLDLVVDPKNRRLIGNPEHGGEQIIDLD